MQELLKNHVAKTLGIGKNGQAEKDADNFLNKLDPNEKKALLEQYGGDEAKTCNNNKVLHINRRMPFR
jgi:hypothetical protein